MTPAERECRRIHKDHSPIAECTIERHFEFHAEAWKNGSTILHYSTWANGFITQLCIDLRDARAELTALRAENQRLQEVCEAVLIFYKAGEWTDEDQSRWMAIIGVKGATTKSLCDTIRDALAAHEQKGEGNDRLRAEP